MQWMKSMRRARDLQSDNRRFSLSECNFIDLSLSWKGCCWFLERNLVNLPLTLSCPRPRLSGTSFKGQLHNLWDGIGICHLDFGNHSFEMSGKSSGELNPSFGSSGKSWWNTNACHEKRSSGLRLSLNLESHLLIKLMSRIKVLQCFCSLHVRLYNNLLKRLCVRTGCVSGWLI